MKILNHKKYDSLYHLHVVKTGGTHLATFLMYNIYNKLKNADVKINKESLENIHAGWKPVEENQYIISSFRDPVKRIISHFFHLLKLELADSSVINRENKWQHFIGGNISNYINPTKNDFFSWLEYNSPHIDNYQSKNFFYKEDIATIPHTLRGATARLYLEGFNDIDVLKNISRVNLLIKTKDMNINNFENLLNKILNDFNLKNKDKVNADILLSNSNKKSLEFYNSLSKKEIEYIESLNTLDLEIYNTDSFFWDPKAFI
jgi:hypothetical protein